MWGHCRNDFWFCFSSFCCSSYKTLLCRSYLLNIRCHNLLECINRQFGKKTITLCLCKLTLIELNWNKKAASKLGHPFKLSRHALENGVKYTKRWYGPLRLSVRPSAVPSAQDNVPSSESTRFKHSRRAAAQDMSSNCL